MLTIEQWAAEMWRRAKDEQMESCAGCPSGETCRNHDGDDAICNTFVAAWHEAGVVPVVKAPERREA